MALIANARLATLPEVIANGGSVPAHMIDAFAARTIYASSIPGVKLDCNLATGAKIGGGTATDNVAAFNAVLATATAANPVHLIIDGPSAVGAALSIPNTGYVTISGFGWGTGFFWKSGSNCNQIQTAGVGTTNLANYNAVHPSAPQTNTGSHVTLSNFSMNCNRGTYPNGVVGSNANDGTLSGAGTPDARGLPSKFFYTSIVLVGIDQLAIDRVFVFDSPTYHINLYGCTNFKITRSKIKAAVANVQNNTDGIHLNGGCVGWTIDDCDVEVGDDSFAINVAEGDATGGDLGVITNCRVNSLTAGRIFGKATATLGRVVFSNITGNVQWYGFVVGESSSADTGADSNRSITLDRINLNILGLSGSPTPPALVLFSGNAGAVTLDGCKLESPTGAYPMVRMDANSPVVSSLRISRSGIYRSSTGNAAAYAVEASNSGAIIKNLMIDGFYVDEQAPNSYSDIPALVNCNGATVLNIKASGRVSGVARFVNVTAASTVGGIVLDDLDHKANFGSGVSVVTATTGHSTKIPVSVGRCTLAGAVIASGDVTLSGPGLASNGIAIDDSLVNDRTVFYSSTQSDLCYKSGGSASPITRGAPPTATGYTITGPSAGTVNVPSGTFSISPNGLFTGTITATPSGGGLSTPIVKTFSSSSAPQTFTITPTSVGTVTLTGTNSASLTNPSPASYAAASGNTLQDSFAGTTDSPLTGHVPNVQFGSIVWSDFLVSNGIPSWVFKSGGGLTTNSTTGVQVYNGYDLTGSLASATETFVFSSTSTATIIRIQSRRNSSGEYVEVTCNYVAGNISVKTVTTGGGSVQIATTSFAWVATTTYTVAVVLATSGGSTNVSVSVNGTQRIAPTAFTDATIQAAAKLVFSTEGGSAGDTTMTSVVVTNP